MLERQLGNADNTLILPRYLVSGSIDLEALSEIKMDLGQEHIHRATTRIWRIQHNQE